MRELVPPDHRLKYILFGHCIFIQCINLQLLIVKSYNKSDKRNGVITYRRLFKYYQRSAAFSYI